MPAHPKPIRVKNRKLLDSYHDRSCLACGYHRSDPCHIKTLKSGGPDAEFNIVPMCRQHHVEQHKIGWDSMRRKYPRLDTHMALMGWQKLNGRLWHPNLAGGDDDTQDV